MLQIENLLAVRKKKKSWLMSEQSGPFMQHMPCLQHRDLDDQLSAASTTIQHCSQTKRCLFAFKLCRAAYQKSTAPNLPLSLQTEISVCPFPTAHCQTSTVPAQKPFEMLVCCIKNFEQELR